jgi:cathepsin L
MGEETYFLKMNQFGDRLPHEVVNSANGFRPHLLINSTATDLMASAAFISPEHVGLPASVDWRKKGGVTEVKQQVCH